VVTDLRLWRAGKIGDVRVAWCIRYSDELLTRFRDENTLRPDAAGAPETQTEQGQAA
jgi:hypothetical protein